MFSRLQRSSGFKSVPGVPLRSTPGFNPVAPSALWSLDIWEGFFKPTRAGRPPYERCGPKGLGNLAQAAVAALWRALV